MGVIWDFFLGGGSTVLGEVGVKEAGAVVEVGGVGGVGEGRGWRGCRGGEGW